MKKLNLVMCFFGLLSTLTLSGCGNNSYSYGKTSYYTPASSASYYTPTSSSSHYTPASSSSYVSDKQKVINHLLANGTGEYYEVTTGTYTTLGYDTSDDYFYTFCSYTTGSTYMSLVTVSTFNSSIVAVSLHIYYGSTAYFKGIWLETISNHKAGGLVKDSMEISVNKYSDTDTLAELMVYMEILAINNASEYLSNKGLPYIY